MGEVIGADYRDMALQGRLACIATLTVAGLLMAGAPSALAAMQWSATKTISDPGELVDFPDVALNAQGRAVAVWYRDDSDGTVQAMRAATFDPRSGFSDPETLGPADPTPGAQPPSLPEIAIDRKGNAIASWLAKDGDGDLRVMVAFQRPGNDFGPPQALSPPGASAFNPQIAFDRQGGAVAVWERADDGVPRAQSADKGPGDDDFGKPEWLSKKGLQAVAPQVGVTDAGAAVAVWLARGGGEGNLFVQAARQPKGGDFGDPQTLSDASLTSETLHLAVGPTGSAMATWSQATPKSEDVGEVASSFAPAGGAFNPPVVMAHDPNLRGFTPRVGMDGSGRATLLWKDGPPEGQAGTNLMRAADADPAGTFGAGQLLFQSDQQSLLFPALAVSPVGNAAAAWIREDPDPLPRPLFATVRPATGSPFGAAQQLSPEGTSAAFPMLAANRKMTLLIWNLLDGDDSRAAVNLYRK
jgi:hypothetical protein